MRAYHGTESDFDRFDTGQGGKLMGVATPFLFFTSSMDNALFYGPLVLECELDLRNPYVVEREEARARPPAQWGWEVLRINREEQAGHDGVILRDVLDGTHYSDITVVFDPQKVAVCGRLDTRE